MNNCSVVKKLEIVPGRIGDYEALSHYHYRKTRLGPFVAIFAVKPAGGPKGCCGVDTAGVIVYTMPSPGLELRNVATAKIFAGFDRQTRLKLINANIRCIARIIIEPRFRSLGLAEKLVRETMGMLNVPIVEAMAVMGLVNPFFEKAGMTAYHGPMPARCAELLEAFSLVGIEEKELIGVRCVQQKLDRLDKAEADFMEGNIRKFLQSYGKRRYMPTSSERTEFVLSKLGPRPVYYIWFNRKLELRV